MPNFASGPAIGAISYVMAQALNLLLQSIVIAKYGAKLYSQVGLAQITVLTLIFLGELGYSLYFVREIQATDYWKVEWKYAQGHRLIVLTAGIVIASLFWTIRYGLNDEGTIFLLCSIPGILFSIYNFSPLYLAHGQYLLGFIGMPLIWMVALVFYLITSLRPLALLSVGSQLGLGISLGFLAQAIFFVKINNDNQLMKLSFGNAGNPILIRSLNLWALSLLGTANERITPFLLQSTAPNFLPVYLFSTQILQGASGILGQINRILLRDQSVLRDTNHSTSTFNFQKSALIATIVIGVLLLCLLGAFFGGQYVSNHENEKIVRLSCLTLFVWLTTALGSVEGMTMIANRFEQYLLSVMLKLVLLSILSQFIGFCWGTADFILWSKVVAGVLILLLCYRKLHIEPSSAVMLTFISLSIGWFSLLIGILWIAQVVLPSLFLFIITNIWFKHREHLICSQTR